MSTVDSRRASILLVDDAAATTQLFGQLLGETIPADVVTASHITDVGTILHAHPDFDAAVVDLSFAHQDGSGLDVLVEVHDTAPSTKLIVLTTGDGWSPDVLRVAWEALPLATALSKTASVEHQIRAIATVIATGSAPVDGVLRAFLPDRRSEYRTAASFGRLVRHKGHAKLWLALLRSSPAAEYAELAALSGLRLNTLRNYRSDLLPELSLHGLDGPTMTEMRGFAHLCRPLLLAHIDETDRQGIPGAATAP